MDHERLFRDVHSGLAVRPVLARPPWPPPRPLLAAQPATNLVLRAKVEQDLARRYSPEQIAGRLRVEFPDQPEMWVSTDTITSRCTRSPEGR